MQPHLNEIERYLREFAPAAPDPLPVSPARPLRWTYVYAAAAAAAVIVAVGLSMRQTPRLQPEGPLTLGSANEILNAAPSWKAAVDGIGFQFVKPRATRSALDYLSQETLTR